MKSYYVYIISNPSGIYYVGYTTDIVRRMEEHNSPMGKYTSERVLRSTEIREDAEAAKSQIFRLAAHFR